MLWEEEAEGREMLSMTQRTPSPQLSAEVETSSFGTKGTGRLHHIKLCSVKSWMVSFSGMCSSVYLFALLMLILQTTWARVQNQYSVLTLALSGGSSLTH